MLPSGVEALSLVGVTFFFFFFFSFVTFLYSHITPVCPKRPLALSYS